MPKNWLARLVPSPLLSLFLLVIWLLLNQSIAPAQLVLGSLLALILPKATLRLRPNYARFAKPKVFFKLIAWSTLEILRSSLNVSRIILRRHSQPPNAQFIKVPLDLRDSTGLAVLSCLINLTPGTVWIEILPETHELSLHVFDLQDTQWWIDTIKQRYEQPLRDIFEQEPT